MKTAISNYMLELVWQDDLYVVEDTWRWKIIMLSILQLDSSYIQITEELMFIIVSNHVIIKW